MDNQQKKSDESVFNEGINRSINRIATKNYFQSTFAEDFW